MHEGVTAAGFTVGLFHAKSGSEVVLVHKEGHQTHHSVPSHPTKQPALNGATSCVCVQHSVLPP